MIKSAYLFIAVLALLYVTVAIVADQVVDKLIQCGMIP
jgi:hypothetical protein